jgi:hypothetical protein
VGVIPSLSCIVDRRETDFLSCDFMATILWLYYATDSPFGFLYFSGPVEFVCVSALLSPVPLFLLLTACGTVLVMNTDCLHIYCIFCQVWSHQFHHCCFVKWKLRIASHFFCVQSELLAVATTGFTHFVIFRSKYCFF